MHIKRLRIARILSWFARPVTCHKCAQWNGVLVHCEMNAVLSAPNKWIQFTKLHVFKKKKVAPAGGSSHPLRSNPTRLLV